MAGIDSYRANLRSLVRGLWTGALTPDQFESQMTATIDRRLRQAWEEGAQECGVAPDELSSKEQLELGRLVITETNNIGNLMSSIIDNSKLNKGKLTPLLDRIGNWVVRYNDAKNQGRVLACGDQKLEWIIGPTERHCPSCSRLDGTVRRASDWDEAGVYPQRPPNSALSCGGWKCQCQLIPSSKKMSRRIPRVP